MEGRRHVVGDTESLVPVVMLVLGVLLLAVVLYDALCTTLATTAAGGPLTARIAAGGWWLARRLARGPRSPLLEFIGPLILVATISLWLVLMWGGWTLIFGHPDAVVSSSTGAPADGWSRLYFAAFTTFTLGIGDFVPNGAPWQVLTSIAVISGLALTTTAITYLVPVVTAVTERRTQASLIASLGGSPQDIVIAGWREGSLAYFQEQLPELAASIMLTAERHLTYPVLHYFHSPQRHKDFRLQLCNLDEAVTLLQHGIPDRLRPHPAALRSIRHASDLVIEVVRTNPSRPDEPPVLDLVPLAEAGIPTVDAATFARRLDDLADHRRDLAAFAQHSPWHGVDA
jgi:hypothetical protein